MQNFTYLMIACSLVSSRKGKKKKQIKKNEIEDNEKKYFIDSDDDEISSLKQIVGNTSRSKSADQDKSEDDIKKNKIFQHIKKEIETRAKSRPAPSKGEQVKQ